MPPSGPVVRAEAFDRTGDHGHGGFGTDGAVLVEEAFGHIEELHLGVVGVGDHSTEKRFGGAGDIGEGVGEEAAGAGFGQGKGGIARAKFVEHDFGERGVAEADEIFIAHGAHFLTDVF